MGVQNLTPIVHNLQVCVILNVYIFFFCSAFCVKTPYLEIDMKHILCKKNPQKHYILHQNCGSHSIVSWWVGMGGGALVKSDLINTIFMYEDNVNCQKDNSIQ